MGIGFGPFAGPGSLRSNPLGLDLSVMHTQAILDETDITGVVDPTFVEGSPTMHLEFYGPQTGTVIITVGGNVGAGIEVGFELYSVDDDDVETPVVIDTNAFANSPANGGPIRGCLATPVFDLVYQQLYRAKVLYRSLSLSGPNIYSRRLIIQPTI